MACFMIHSLPCIPPVLDKLEARHHVAPLTLKRLPITPRETIMF